MKGLEAPMIPSWHRAPRFLARRPRFPRLADTKLPQLTTAAAPVQLLLWQHPRRTVGCPLETACCSWAAAGPAVDSNHNCRLPRCRQLSCCCCCAAAAMLSWAAAPGRAARGTRGSRGPHRPRGWVDCCCGGGYWAAAAGEHAHTGDGHSWGVAAAAATTRLTSHRSRQTGCFAVRLVWKKNSDILYRDKNRELTIIIIIKTFVNTFLVHNINRSCLLWARGGFGTIWCGPGSRFLNWCGYGFQSYFVSKQWKKLESHQFLFSFAFSLNNKQKKLLKIKFTYLTDNILSNLFKFS